MPDGTLPCARVKSFANYKQKTYFDPHVSEYLMNKRHSFWKDAELEEVLRGNKTLPYGQAVFTEKAWEQGLNKYFPNRPKLTDEQRSVLDQAEGFLHRQFAPFMMGSKTVSHDHAVEHLRKDTSTGFPFSYKYQKKGNFMRAPEGDEYLRQFWEDTSVMNGPRTYYKASLKGELRPIEKVEAEKTRVFMAGPIESAYVGHRLFFEQRQRMQKGLFQTSSCIGIRQVHLDFDTLHHMWREFDKISSLDANNWDGSILGELIVRVAKFRWNMLAKSERTEENWNRLCNLYRDAVFTHALFPDGHICRTNGGVPSGFSLTADDNTLIHFIVMAYVWIRKVGGTYDEFVDHVKLSLYGDDNIVCWTNHVDPMWNVANIISTCKELGISFEEAPFTFECVPFLGHKIVPVFYRSDKYYVGVRNFWNIFCGWLLDGDGSWETSVERSLAYRIQAFFVPELFEMIDDYCIDTLALIDPQQVSVLWSQFLSVPIIESLYFMKTQGFSGVVRSCAPEKFQIAYQMTSHVKNQRKIRNRRINGTGVSSVINEKQLSERLQSGADSAIAQITGNAAVRVRGGRNSRRGEVSSNSSQTRMPALTELSRRSKGTASGRENRHAVVASIPRGPGYTRSTMAERYMRCVLAPWTLQSRIPDDDSAMTALLYSKQEYPITVNMNNGGRFSFAVQPILGNLSSPMQYKIAITNPALTAWEPALGGPQINWADPASYLQVADGAWTGVDQYQQQMTSPPVFNTVFNSNGGTSPGNPFGNSILVNQLSSLPLVGTFTNENPSVFQLPAGSYTINLRISGTGLPGGGPTYVFTGPAPTTQEADQLTSSDGTLTYVNIIFTSSTPITWSVEITAATTVTAATMTINPAWSGSMTTGFMDGGTIVSLRPVAQTLLYTSEIAPINDGGVIAATRVQGNSLLGGFFNTATAQSQKQLQFHEQVYTTPLGKRWKHCNGAFAWWCAQDPSDYEFLPPSKSVLRPYPSLVVSGQIQNGSTSSALLCGTVVVCSLWEFTTNQTNWSQQQFVGGNSEMESVKKILAGEPAVVKNDAHVGFIKNTWDKALPYLKAAAPYVIPVAKAITMGLSAL
jgi:hypothetical protein